ncbi:HflC protein [Candidatus Bathyarchaeota archaeon ex4484_231]|nr:MAG: HflC protein [Candidatus Bathyarchaeota archaeon ex4484_231]RJS75980.1 MAG: prohibitin family protein [Candidatus Bathyarchaeota archaeon]
MDYPLEDKKGRKRMLVVVPLIILLVGSLLVLSQGIVIVPSGMRGIVLTWGSVTNVLGEGLHFVTPLVQQVVFMDVTIQKVETSESTASKDLQEVTTTIAVNYRVIPDRAGDVYRILRKEYEYRVIRPNIEESIKATTALFEAEELITKRETVKAKFKEILSQRLAQYHIEVLATSIVDFQFSPEFSKAIEAKVTAQQRALEAKNKLEQIRYEAQQKVIQAEAEANATIARAKAQAEAVRLIRESLTADYLTYIAIEKWNGVLPYFFGGETLPFIQIPTNSTSNP